MGIKKIRKRLAESEITATVRYQKENKRGQNEYTCMYAITFPPIEGLDYWDKPIEVIDQYDAFCKIYDYIEDRDVPTIPQDKIY